MFTLVQKNSLKNIFKLIFAACFFLHFSACTKKRDESFVQGQGRDLLTIADFDGKEFDAETLGSITNFKENLEVSKKDDTNVAKKNKTADAKMTAPVTEKNCEGSFSAVKVETKADFLEDSPFIGLKGCKVGYKIRYQLTKDMLVVLKVADKKLIHPQEIPSSQKMDDQRIAVPIVGYKIKGYFNVENVDQNGEKSNKLTEIAGSDKSSAKYFKVDRNDKTLFKIQEKLDLFGKNYFTGENDKSEWYFAQTIIAAGKQAEGYTGWVLNEADEDSNTLTKVKFITTRSELKAININVDSRTDLADEMNQTPLVSIPIEWKDYRLKPVGKDSISMEEEENTAVEWDKRRFLKIYFAGSSTRAMQSSNFKFVDLEIEENYFSYTLYDPNYNIRIKQSFLRDSGRKQYTPKRMFKEDFEKFGFFDTQKAEINNFEKYMKEDFGKNNFINRYNVENGEVVFYFTEGSDEKLIPFAAKAADEWSKAFKAAGVPLVIRADTEKRVSLGDVRYNQINLFRTTKETRLYGYGPSITDARTGEIISATTNMHITTILYSLVDHIRDYMLFKSGKSKIFSIYTRPLDKSDAVTSKGDKVALDPTSKANKLIAKFPLVKSNGAISLHDIETIDPKTEKDKIKSKIKTREFDLGLTGKNLNAEIDKECPELEKVAAAIASESRDEKENELVIACAEKLLPHKMFGTLLHEMGHNFGLRHNFYGSVDAINFLSKEETGSDDQVQSSSVMEYPSYGEDRLNNVGRYDIAAIRYGYGDSVETTDGNTLKLNPSKTIQENLGESGKSAKKYMFCTDEDIMVGTDPLCARFDAGSNAEQVVKNLINEYNASIADMNYRLGRQRAYDPGAVTNSRINRYWIPMKKIYDEYRYKLNDVLGIGNEFLENYDAAKLDSAIAEKTSQCKPSEDPQSSACQLLYYQRAADEIFKFAMQIATLTPKYCIGERNLKPAIIEFADVRRIIMAVNKKVPSSCMDEDVKAYILEKFAFTPKTESGYELEDVRLDMKVKMSNKTDWFGNPIPEPPDIIGLMPEKMIAMQVLAVRTPLTYSSEEKQFLPNFLDEPKSRDTVLEYLADRLSKGISGQKLMAGAKNTTTFDKNLFFENFKYERKYIDSMVYSVFSGLEVPDKNNATLERKKKFNVRYTDKKDILDKAKYKVAGSDGTSFYAIMNDDATEVKKLLQKLETLPKRIESASPLDENTFTALTDAAKTILSSDDSKVDPKALFDFAISIIDDEVSAARGKPRSKDQQKIDKYRPHWKNVFKEEVSIVKDILMGNSFPEGEMSSAIEVFSADIRKYKDPSSSDRVSEEYLSSFNKVSKLIYSSSYKLNQKTLAERIQKYRDEKAKEPVSTKSDESYSFDELKTQIDMLENVIKRYMKVD